MLHDGDLAHAIVDRILERGRVLTLDGPSMRTKHLGLDDATSLEASHPPARISGTHTSWFRAGADLQVVNPARQRNKNALVGGVRANIAF